MTRKEQIKILDNKIKSNNNQYKIDSLNAEISAFSDGDLNKYEFLTRKDLKYKPNALDKVRFEFSPLGKAFNMGLDKTVQGYQEEGVIKLLKDIRDGLANGVNRPRRPGRLDDDDDDHHHHDNLHNLVNNFKSGIDDDLNKLLNIRNKELEDSINKNKELENEINNLSDSGKKSSSLLKKMNELYRLKNKELKDLINKNKELENEINNLSDGGKKSSSLLKK